MAVSKVGEAWVLLKLQSRAFSQQLKGARAQFAMGVRGMESVARRAKIGLLLGAGMAAAVVKMAATFEQSMARVRALTGATGDAFKELEAKAMELGRTTVFSASQAAEAMSAFALAGFDANKIIGAMPATLDLAAAGQIDVGQAADIAAKIMAGMGLEADELTNAVDVLTKAFTTSNTDLVMLGEAMKFVGPVAKSMGVGLEEVTGAIQLMSNAGIQGAMAGTSLRGILSRLAGGTPETTKIMKDLGISVTDAAGKMRPLADIIDDLNKAMMRMDAVEKVGLMMKAFGQRAGPAMAELLAQGGDALRENVKALEDAGGTAKRIADIQLATFLGQLKLLKSAAEGLAITLGNQLVPMLRKVSESLTDTTSRMADMDPDRVTEAISRFVTAMKAMAAITIGAKILGVFAGMGVLFALGASAPIVLGVTALGLALGVAAEAFGLAAVKGSTFREEMDKIIAGFKELALGADDATKAQRHFDRELDEFAMRDEARRARLEAGAEVQHPGTILQERNKALVDAMEVEAKAILKQVKGRQELRDLEKEPSPRRRILNDILGARKALRLLIREENQATTLRRMAWDEQKQAAKDVRRIFRKEEEGFALPGGRLMHPSVPPIVPTKPTKAPPLPSTGRFGIGFPVPPALQLPEPPDIRKATGPSQMELSRLAAMQKMTNQRLTELKGIEEDLLKATERRKEVRDLPPEQRASFHDIAGFSRAIQESLRDDKAVSQRNEQLKKLDKQITHLKDMKNELKRLTNIGGAVD